MKTLSAALLVLAIVASLTVSAYPLTYRLPFGEREISVGDTISVTVKLADYSCDDPTKDDVPVNGLFGVQLYFGFDPNKMRVVEAYAMDSDKGGPFDQGLCGFIEQKPGIYQLNVSKFDYYVVEAYDEVLLGVITLEATAGGDVVLKAANKLGPGFDDDT